MGTNLIITLGAGLIVGHMLGIISAIILTGFGDRLDWSKHECRTCVHFQDDMLTPTCGSPDGPRSGGRTDVFDVCEAWTPRKEMTE